MYKRQISNTEFIINRRLYRGVYSVDIITEFETTYGKLSQYVCDTHDMVSVPCPVHFPIDYVLWIFSYDEDEVCDCEIDEKSCPVHALRDFNNANYFLLNIKGIRGVRPPQELEKLIIGGFS